MSADRREVLTVARLRLAQLLDLDDDQPIPSLLALLDQLDAKTTAARGSRPVSDLDVDLAPRVELAQLLDLPTGRVPGWRELMRGVKLRSDQLARTHDGLRTILGRAGVGRGDPGPETVTDDLVMLVGDLVAHTQRTDDRELAEALGFDIKPAGTPPNRSELLRQVTGLAGLRVAMAGAVGRNPDRIGRHELVSEVNRCVQLGRDQTRELAQLRNALAGVLGVAAADVVDVDLLAQVRELVNGGRAAVDAAGRIAALTDIGTVGLTDGNGWSRIVEAVDRLAAGTHLRGQFALALAVPHVDGGQVPTADQLLRQVRQLRHFREAIVHELGAPARPALGDLVDSVRRLAQRPTPSQLSDERVAAVRSVRGDVTAALGADAPSAQDHQDGVPGVTALCAAIERVRRERDQLAARLDVHDLIDPATARRELGELLGVGSPQDVPSWSEVIAAVREAVNPRELDMPDDPGPALAAAHAGDGAVDETYDDGWTDDDPDNG